jgi:Tol biopolymer transport system component
VETGEKRKLTNNQKISCNYSWSPDGKNIIGVDGKTLVKINLDLVGEIQEYDIPDIRTIGTIDTADCSGCEWDDFEVYDMQRSLDGNRIAFVIGLGVFRGLHIFDLDTQTITHVRDYKDFQTNTQFLWGYKDEFMYYRALYGGKTNLYMVHLNTNISKPITDFENGLYYGVMAVSPDAEKIAYKFGTHDVYLEKGLIIETHENEEIAKIMGTIGEVAWSPDSIQVTYEKDGKLYLFDMDTMAETMLSSAGSNISSIITWSAGDSKILFVRDEGIFMIDVDSREETKILNEQEVYNEPSFRPQQK